MANMTDRELLEAAAKAAGIDWSNWTKSMYGRETQLRDWPYDWNPLINDGDAFRLMVQLSMGVDTSCFIGTVCALAAGAVEVAQEIPGEDRAVATRRAIVRAAAAVEVIRKEIKP